MDFQLLGALLDLDDSFFGYVAGVDDLVRLQLIAEKPQYLTVLGCKFRKNGAAIPRQRSGRSA